MEKQIKISEKLQKAREYESYEGAHRQMSEKPSFHACVPVGWMNDPNGFSEYEGEKHLFFQYYPYDTVWGPMHWGHMKTNDFIRWEHLPAALAPDEDYDGAGCFSGSAVTWKGKHLLAYTGVERKKDKTGQASDYQMQCIAIGDGINYKKLAGNPVITAQQVPEGGSVLDFRDPKIWVEENGIYMAVANRAADGCGRILLYRTADAAHWDFVTVLDACGGRYGRMWECPDFFSLDGIHVLIVSPQEMAAKEHEFHAGDGTIYMLGIFDKEQCVFTERTVRALDAGLDFYAPQTMQASDGRRIMIGWMQSWSAAWFNEKDGFCGMMAIPRELHVRNEVLCQNPVRELESYYSNRVVLKGIVPGGSFVRYDELSGRIQNLDLTLHSEEEYQFELRVAADDKFYSGIIYNKGEQLLTFRRNCSGVRRDAAHERTVKVLSNGSAVKLRIVMDRYSVEIFLNDGEQVMTSIIRTPMETDGIYMRASGNLTVDAVKHDICADWMNTGK